MHEKCTIQCTHCPETFFSIRDMNTHACQQMKDFVSDLQNPVGIVKCPKCPDLIAKPDLAQHLQISHGLLINPLQVGNQVMATTKKVVPSKEVVGTVNGNNTGGVSVDDHDHESKAEDLDFEYGDYYYDADEVVEYAMQVEVSRPHAEDLIPLKKEEPEEEFTFDFESLKSAEVNDDELKKEQ